MTETIIPPEHGWVCFHCGEHFPNTFVGQRDAAYHFGTTPSTTPACKLDRKEKALLVGVRKLEIENARYRAEHIDKEHLIILLRRVLESNIAKGCKPEHPRLRLVYDIQDVVYPAGDKSCC